MRGNNLQACWNSAESWAFRCLMLVDAGDEVGLGMTLAEFQACPHCVAGVVIVLASMLRDTLDAAECDGPRWRPVLGHRLTDLLDVMAAAQ